jgi:hypothetical protein
VSNLCSSIALRIWHPALSASDVIYRIALPAQFANSVGEQRRTPKGHWLKGLYAQTYCCFQLKKKAASQLEQDLVPWCEFLEQRLLFMHELTRSGGRAEFRIAIFVDGDRGFELSNLLIRRIYMLGLELSIEMYRLSDNEINPNRYIESAKS